MHPRWYHLQVETLSRISGSLEYDYARSQKLDLPPDRRLYLMTCREFVKIGVARNVRSRLVMIRTGNPYDVKLFGQYKVEDAGKMEADLHKEFARFQVRGEWFKIRPIEIEGIIFRMGGMKVCP